MDAQTFLKYHFASASTKRAFRHARVRFNTCIFAHLRPKHRLQPATRTLLDQRSPPRLRMLSPCTAIPGPGTKEVKCILGSAANPKLRSLDGGNRAWVRGVLPQAHVEQSPDLPLPHGLAPSETMVWDHGLNPPLSTENPRNEGFSGSGAPIFGLVSRTPHPRGRGRPFICWNLDNFRGPKRYSQEFVFRSLGRSSGELLLGCKSKDSLPLMVAIVLE